MEKCYLGDSVYIHHDDCGLILTTENGGPPSNTIFLEPAVLKALVKYVEALTGASIEDL